MYLDHFQLTDYPFVQSAKDELYFETEQNAQHISDTQHWLETGHGMLVVTGERGVGRTAMIHRAVQTSQLKVECISLNGTELSDADFCHYIALEFGLSPRNLDFVSLRHAVKKRLKNTASIDHRVCLLVENAERLTVPQLRLLADLSADYSFYYPLCHVVLEGDSTLMQQVLSGFDTELSNGVALNMELSLLTEQQTRGYLSHRLGLFDTNDTVLFTASIAGRIHQQTGGIPMAIDRLADRALVQAYERGSSAVTLQHLASAVSDLGWTQKFKSLGTIDTHSALPDSQASKKAILRNARETTKRKKAAARKAMMDKTLNVDERRQSKLPGSRLPGSRLPGAKLPGSRLPGSKLPASRLPGVRPQGAQLSSARQPAQRALEKSVHRLIREVTTIGRAPDCSIRIDEKNVSPYQALIVRTGDGMFIRNEGGSSPIYLNASRVDTASLNHGDTVKIGKYELSLSVDRSGTPTLISVPGIGAEV